MVRYRLSANAAHVPILLDAVLDEIISTISHPILAVLQQCCLCLDFEVFLASQNELPTSVLVFSNVHLENFSVLLLGLCTCGQLVATTSCLLRSGGGNWNFDFDDCVTQCLKGNVIIDSKVVARLRYFSIRPIPCLLNFLCRSNLLGNVRSRIGGSYTTGGSAH